jgi:hypothetical protein
MSINIIDLPRDIFYLIFDILLLKIYDEILRTEDLFYWYKSINEKRKKKKITIKNSCGLGRTCKTIYDYLKQYEVFVNNSSAEMQYISHLQAGRCDSNNIINDFIKEMIKEKIFDANLPKYLHPFKDRDIFKYNGCSKIIILRGQNTRPISPISLLIYKRHMKWRHGIILQRIWIPFERRGFKIRFSLCESRSLTIFFSGLNNSDIDREISMFIHGHDNRVMFSVCKLIIDDQNNIVVTCVNDFCWKIVEKNNVKNALAAANDIRFGENTMKEIGFRLLDLVEMLRAGSRFKNNIYEKLEKMINYVFGRG